jgi:hypothetical protein
MRLSYGMEDNYPISSIRAAFIGTFKYSPLSTVPVRQTALKTRMKNGLFSCELWQLHPNLCAYALNYIAFACPLSQLRACLLAALPVVQ